jgi:hypothetical protein
MWVRKLTAVTGVAASPGASVSIKDGDQTQGTAEVSADSVLRSHVVAFVVALRHTRLTVMRWICFVA